MAAIKIIDLCKGVPFVDNEFCSSKLWGAIAAKRASISKHSFYTEENLLKLIAPENAIKFARKYYDKPESIHAKLATKNQIILIENAHKYILDSCPDWEGLIKGPFLYFSLNKKGVYSMSNPLIPQSIFLGPEAYKSLENLPETIIHELSHVWCALLHEITPLVNGYNQTFTLPSGTKGKTTLGLLLAAHFAASALAFHLQMYNPKENRMLYLYEYLSRVLDTLKNTNELTDEGKQISLHLHQFYNRKKYVFNKS